MEMINGYIARYSEFQKMYWRTDLWRKSGVFNQNGEPCFNLECDFNENNDSYVY